LIPFVSDALALIPIAERAGFLRARRESLCYHEAGHLVAASRLGFPLRKVACEIIDADAGHAKTYFEGGLVKLATGSSRSRSRIEEAIVVLLAGGAAVSKLRASFEAGRGWMVEDDDRKAKLLVDELTPELNDRDLPWLDCEWSFCGSKETEKELYFQTLLYRSHRFVSLNWKAIERIAGALAEAGNISARSVDRLMKGF